MALNQLEKVSNLLLSKFCYLLLDLASVYIDEKDLELITVISKGQFGRVHKAFWKGLKVAVKEIPKGYGDPDLAKVDICR